MCCVLDHRKREHTPRDAAQGRVRLGWDTLQGILSRKRFGMAGFSTAAWSLLPSCAQAPAGTGEESPGWEGGLGTGGQRDGKGITELKSFPHFQCETCGVVPRTQVTPLCTDVSNHDLIP